MTRRATATAGGDHARKAEDREEREQRRHAANRWRLLAGVWLIYLVYLVPTLWSDHGWAGRLGGAVLVVAFCWVYLGVVPRVVTAWGPAWFSGRNPQATPAGPHRFTVPLLMAALMAGYVTLIGSEGYVLGSYLAPSVMTLLPLPTAVTINTVLAAVLLWLPPAVDQEHVHGPIWPLGLSVLTSTAVLAVVRLIGRGSAELREARAEIVRLAAEAERLRIGRDLHDLLGHAFTTVTLKAELAGRLALRDPARAAAEMTEVAALSRQGLADMRAAVGGYREVTLAGEVATARQVLRAAGISGELPGAVEQVPAELRELFGWVLREGITNVVRHSRARHVRVVLQPDSLEIVDDGRGGDTVAGNGLTGLAERVRAAGGRLEYGDAAGGGFRLQVRMTTAASTTPPGNDGRPAVQGPREPRDSPAGGVVRISGGPG